ncbi:hypothetical protein AB0L00_11125 [Actinoallomurus sp. NPDC052308]|uniref:hypothetical protein n=1 Tax=Actinoallomurus sp. NPDC052308 TaxID=3155530 RepID=UPI00342B713E
MIHLVYTFRPTPYAQENLPEFWEWVRDREDWFYDGLDMVLKTDWFVRTIGPDVHCVEHFVAFADEAAWGAYRRAVSAKSRDPKWEARRIEQGRWYDILDARILSDPPVRLGRPSAATPA